MVCVWEYRVVLPFTLEEYKIAQLYMVAKYSASESNGSDGDGVELLKNEPFEEDDRRGQYTHKLYHLASKLPSWLVGLFPKKALMLEEEAWNAYPYCMTVLKCPFFSNFRLVLETRHIADRGSTSNALDLDSKTLKKRIVDFIDIAMDPVENYVEEEDPSKFRSTKTARGPLLEGWQQTCEPVMCAYKLVTVDVPYWGFGSRLEKFIGKTAQRKIFLEGHRKCFCWLDEWFGLTMEDVRRMEYETAEAIRRARAMAIGRPEEEAADIPAAAPATAAGDDASGLASVAEEASDTATALRNHDSSGGAGPLKELSFNSRKDYSRSNSRELASPRLLRPPSLVGPSVAVGITTLSASELDSDSFVMSSTMPTPSMRSPRASGVFRSARNSFTEERKKSPGPAAGTMSALHRADSYEFLPSLESSSERNGSNSWHISPSTSNASGIDNADEDVMSQCVDVLDRVIAWTKVRAASQRAPAPGDIAGAPPASSASPAGSASEASPAAEIDSSNGNKQPSSLPEDVKSSSAFNLNYYVSVLDRAVSLLTKRRQQ